ncbi:ATP-binding protein [Streptomyces sp. NPDC001110]|uniref:ATP-binding protein n=1 Tax=Streptomyces sp. M3 TaxID=295102 RepID=UPI00100F73DC|nr:ATP-binding protein [Streptomyces sp. M3]
MDEGVGRDGVARAAVTMGLSLDSQREDDLPALGELDPLHEAPAHAASVFEALRGFGYTERWQPGEVADPGEQIRKSVTCEDTEILVVHVVAHGELAATGERGLHVVGRDGKNLDDSVFAWIGLIESHPNKQRPMTLFILDLCHSGAAATLSWHQQMSVERRRAWVIAASEREGEAFDFRLSRATTAVLHRYLDGSLHVDPSYQYIPLSTIGREISREVVKLNVSEGYDQQIDASRIPFIANPDELPFFPNPSYSHRESALTNVDADIASMLDDAFDPWHFMLRGAGTEPLERRFGPGYFRGREQEVQTLARWLNGHGAGLRIVTGKPGVGKSALLGVLICAAHPKLRDSTQRLWWLLSAKPGLNDRLAVVHARRRDFEQIIDSIARQMGAVESDRPEGGWDAQHLVELAQASQGAPYTVVIDALDEAERPEDVTQILLLPLARAAVSDNSRLRLLVGTRSEERFSALADLAEGAEGLLNLDNAQPHDIHHALRQYVGDLLAVDTPYAAREAADAATALAEGIATRLTGVGDLTSHEHVTRPLGWGEFLVAGLYLRHVLTLPTQHDPDLARDIGLAAPMELPDLLELDLARHNHQPYLRPVLAALAHAEGRGMPERVLAHAASVFTDLASSDSPLPTDHLRTALVQARFYLRHDVDIDGTTLYRLFHEGLAERLRSAPHARNGEPHTR